MTEVAFFLLIVADILVADLLFKRRSERHWAETVARYARGMKEYWEDRLNGTH